MEIEKILCYNLSNEKRFKGEKNMTIKKKGIPITEDIICRKQSFKCWGCNCEWEATKRNEYIITKSVVELPLGYNKEVYHAEMICPNCSRLCIIDAKKR